MHGKLDQDQLFKEMSVHSVFVMPSNLEGLSKATLEAGALGLSIIAKDAPESEKQLLITKMVIFIKIAYQSSWKA